MRCGVWVSLRFFDMYPNQFSGLPLVLEKSNDGVLCVATIHGC